jgi:DNA processing protein
LVGIVGARNASAAGRKLAASLAGGLGSAGFGTVSGLARGIDTEVHRASLAGGTVAVLAGGLDRPYPPENAGLLREIIAKGAAVSEMPFGLSPRGRDFPRRNRLVSGLSLGIVVVEAARHSGSLITARFAGEQGREVFAVPGSPLDPRAEGTNDLIRDGASLVTSAADVLAILKPLAGEAERAPLLFREPAADSAEPIDDEWTDADETAIVGPGTGDFDAEDESEGGDVLLPADLRLLQLVSTAPVNLDDLGRLAGLDPRTLQALVTELELAGEVERLGGNRLVRVVRG